MGWLSDYEYRKKVTISGSSGAGENYQVKLKIGSSSGGDFHLEGHCEDFPNDIRFTDNDGTTPLDYWIEDPSEDPITVWVEVNDNLDNNVDIYVYYGKSGEVSASDAEATFIRVINGNQPVKGSWHFDENSGIIAEDTSGNDYDGSIHGADWTTGKFGSALSFNGSSDYVDCENVGTSIDKTYSVSLWFKVDSLSHEMQIFSGGGTSGDNRYPDIVLWTSGKIGFRINDADPGACSAEGLISSNTWYHVVGVVESDGKTTRLYVNGDEKATHVHTSDAVFYDDVNIGRRGNDTNYFDGIIDEVFVFNRALSAEEISDLYNNYGYTTINYPGRVLIRKYVSPEPTFSSAGSEETSFSCTDIIGLQDSSSRSGPIVGSCTDILDSTSSSSLLKIAPWLSGFSYRKRLIINGSNGAGTGYQIKLKIGSSSGGDFHLNGHCSDFPNDIRFTKDDGLTLLKYWIEDPSEDPITVWVKIDDNLDSNKEIYCYYGSSIASSLSDGEETFEFFDDFLGTPYQVSFANISTNTYGNGIYPPQYPQAIYVPSQNKTYIIFQTRYVGRHIIEYDHSTKTFQNETDIGGHTLWGENQPGHGAPALGIDGDGYLYVFYGSHGGPQYYKKSTNPYDITSWGSEQTLVSAATYPQVFWTDNKLWVFYRNGPQEWVYKTTSDGGSTWSNEVEITDFDSQPNFWGVYARTMKAPNGDIHIVWLWRNDANDYFNLYYAYYDISEGKWKKRDGTELTLPISESEADKVFDGSHTWIWGLDIDENNEPYIFWAYSGDNKLKLTKWKNSAWHTYNITDYPFYKSGSFGALKVDDSSNLRVIADSSDHKTAKLYKSTDGGETWQFVKIVSEELPGMEYGPGSGAGFQSVFNANSELEFLLGPGDNPQDNGICGAWGQDSDFTHNEYIYDLSNKWNINKNPEVENGILTCTGEDNEAVHSKTTFLYKALKVRAKVTHGGSDDAGNVGFATDLNGGNLNAERFWVVTPTRTKVCSGNAENQECTDITSYNAAWHIWEVLWKEGEAKFIVDDNLEATHSTYVCEQAIPIMFQSYRPDATTEVDWVFVRKYVSPEPSFSGAQAEEGPVFTCGDTLANSVASSVHRDIFPTCLETLSCQDTLFSLLSSICRSQDSLGLMDSSVSLAVLLLNAIDSIDVSDGCTLSLSFSSSCLDVLHAIDSASYPLPNVVSCLDSLGTQDSFSSLLSMLCQSKDNIGGADGETSQLSVERALLDILAFQDTSSYLAGIIASASDVLNVQDLNSIRLTFSCSSIDIIKNVDSGGINVTFHLSGDDILKGADYVSGNLQVLLDSLSVFKNTDQSASSLLGFILRSASDVLDMYDLNTATLQISSSSIDLFRTEDNSSINITFHLNSADVFKNSDSAILNLQALLSALEALEISDSSASSLFAEILASASDLLSASDYNEIRLEFLNSSIDVIKSEDGVTPNFTLHLNSSDILHGLDSVTAKLEAILHAMSEFKSTDESSTRKKVVLVTPVKIFKAQQKILIFKAENI